MALNSNKSSLLIRYFVLFIYIWSFCLFFFLSEIATKHIKDADRLSIDQQYKMKDRWNQEYNWTQKFQQPYIVAGVKLGEESKDFINYLNKNHVWQLPVIILEYCNGGDVRKLLQRPQNANGMLENQY